MIASPARSTCLPPLPHRELPLPPVAGPISPSGRQTPGDCGDRQVAEKSPGSLTELKNWMVMLSASLPITIPVKR